MHISQIFEPGFKLLVMNYQTKLADELRNGNEDALFSLMTIYYKDFFKYGLKLTTDRNLTKDVIQQFILHIWGNRAKFNLVENVESYLFVSFKRFMIRELQKISRHNSIHVENTNDVEYQDEEFMIVYQQNELLQKMLFKAIESLPRRQKELLLLRYYEQLSFEEISQKTLLSIRTIYNNLHEALKKLRSHDLLKGIRSNIYN